MPDPRKTARALVVAANLVAMLSVRCAAPPAETPEPPLVPAPPPRACVTPTALRDQPPMAWELPALRDFLTDNALVEKNLRAARTGQEGQAEPAPLPVADLDAALGRIRATWDSVVGRLPSSCVPLAPELDHGPAELPLSAAERTQAGFLPGTQTIEVDSDGKISRITVRYVRYRGAHGEPIPAFLLIPEGASAPRPAVLVLHQTLSKCGKKETLGACLEPEAQPWLDFARDLAAQGLVTLAADAIGFGERAEHYREVGNETLDAAPLLSRFPGASLMGLVLSDHQRGIEFLATRPEVDVTRIGVIGHSKGGVEALWLAALDARLRCTVANPIPNFFRRETFALSLGTAPDTLALPPGIARWAGFGYLPALAYFAADRDALPVETHQLGGLVAPRGLFATAMEDDSIAPTYDRVDFWFGEVKKVYAARGGDFTSLKIPTQRTPACRAEWGPSLCLQGRYEACADASCRAALAAVGFTDTCIFDNDSVQGCAHYLYWTKCRQSEGRSEAACIARFATVGVNASCIDAAYQSGCRADHGWYPEVEARAYPWLAACLSR